MENAESKEPESNSISELEKLLAESLFEMIVKKINPHDPGLLVINQSPKK